MAEIGFYHLTRTAADVALPALLGRTLAAGQRAVVRLPTAERLAALDRSLWECRDPDWLPHGTTDPALQPIWLAVADDGAPNGAAFLFLIEGATGALAGFTRVFDLFDGGDPDQVAAARRRWTAAKADGHALTYWRQGDSGWQKEA